VLSLHSSPAATLNARLSSPRFLIEEGGRFAWKQGRAKTISDREDFAVLEVNEREWKKKERWTHDVVTEPESSLLSPLALDSHILKKRLNVLIRVDPRAVSGDTPGEGGERISSSDPLSVILCDGESFLVQGGELEVGASEEEGGNPLEMEREKEEGLW